MTRPPRNSAPRLGSAGRRWSRRLLVACTVLLVVLPAGIARAASPPDSLTILGPGMSAPITIPSDTQADLYANLLRQVGWMVGRTGDYTKPDLKTVGPKYTIMVFAAGIATQVYDVYPEAAGGPRAFRPGRQPSGKNGTDAWFYATVTLPSVLRDAGVNLPEPVVSGQAAGSGYDPQYQPEDLSTSSSFSFSKELSEARLAFVATAATSVLVLVMLFGAAQISRRRWNR